MGLLSDLFREGAGCDTVGEWLQEKGGDIQVAYVAATLLLTRCTIM